MATWIPLRLFIYFPTSFLFFSHRLLFSVVQKTAAYSYPQHDFCFINDSNNGSRAH